MKKCWWKSCTDRLAWCRVATNLSFVGNVISAKNNKTKHNKARYACDACQALSTYHKIPSSKFLFFPIILFRKCTEQYSSDPILWSSLSGPYGTLTNAVILVKSSNVSLAFPPPPPPGFLILHHWKVRFFCCKVFRSFNKSNRAVALPNPRYHC